MFFKKVVNELDPVFVNLEATKVIGVKKQTSAKELLKDITYLSRQYGNSRKTLTTLKTPREFITMSYNYSLSGKNFDFFLGDVAVEAEEHLPQGFLNVTLPAGNYLKITVKAKNKMSLGKASNDLKEVFYKTWIHESNYELHDELIEYEWHGEKSLKRHPEIDIYVRIK